MSDTMTECDPILRCLTNPNNNNNNNNKTYTNIHYVPLYKALHYYH